MNRNPEHKRPLVHIRRVQGPHWITAQRGRLRYSVRAFVVKTTRLPSYSGGAR